MAKSNLKKSTSDSAFSVKGANEEIKALKKQNIARAEHNKKLSQTAQNIQRLSAIGTNSIPVLIKQSKDTVSHATGSIVQTPNRNVQYTPTNDIKVQRTNPFEKQNISVNSDFQLNTNPYTTVSNDTNNNDTNVNEKKKITFNDINDMYMSARKGLINGATFGLLGLLEDKAKEKGIPVLPTVTSADMMQAMTNPDYLKKRYEEEQNAVENQKVANAVGNVAGNLLSSGLLGGAAGNAVEGLGIKSGFGKFAASMGADLGVDAIADTIPNTLKDVNEGKDKETVLKNLGKNVATNAVIDLVANGLFQGIPALKRSRNTNTSNIVSDTTNSAKKAINDVEYQNVSTGITDIPNLKYNVVDNITIPKNANVDMPEIPVVKNNNMVEIEPDVFKMSDDAKNAVKIPSLKNMDFQRIDDNGTIPLTDMSKDTAKSRYSSQSVPNKSDLNETISQSFVNDPEIYNVLHNADTKAKADKIAFDDSMSITEKISAYRTLLASKDASAVPLGYELSKQLIDAGEYDAAVDMVRDMSRELTKAGQFTQSAAITLLKENPQAAMRYATKEIDSINTAGLKKFGKKWKNISLTDDEIKAFANVSDGDSEGIKAIYDSIGQRLSKEIPSTAWEKVVELTKLNMLFNPRTHIRNAVANVLMTPIRSVSDRVSALGQHAIHIINPDVEITQSLTGSIGGQYKKIANQVFDERIKPMLDNSDKWEDLGNAMYKKQVFKDNKVVSGMNKGLSNLSRKFGLDKLADGIDNNLKGSMLENLRNFDYWLLSTVEDDPFVKMNFSNRLASYMKAKGIKKIDDIPEEAISLAYDEALKATFKDDNMLTKMLSGLKKTTGKFGEVALPFTKTPANLAMRAIDYSPVGIISTIKNSSDPAKTIDNLSKNLTGTGLIALGVILAREGIIRGSLSDDKNTQAFQKQQGKQEFSFVLGNGVEIPYNWAQPAATGLIIGATIYDAISNSDQELNIGQIAINAGKAAVNEWFALSPLQSLQELFAGSGYGENDIAQNFINAGGDFLTRFIPSLSNASAKTNDTSQRTSYVKGNNLQTLINQSKAKIPFLRETLPVSHDTWGNEKQTASSKSQAFLNNFILPSNASTVNPTSIDDEIQRLYDTTGIDSVFPKKVDWSDTINNQKYNLDNYAYEEKQKVVGQKSYEFAESLINSDFYDRLDDERKVETLNALYGFSNFLYLHDKYGKEPTSEYKKMYEKYENGGTDELIKYMQYKNELGIVDSNHENIDMTNNDSNFERWQNGGMNELEQYARYKESSDMYKAVETTVISNSKDLQQICKDYSGREEYAMKTYTDLKNNSTVVNEEGEEQLNKIMLFANVDSTFKTENEKGYWLYYTAGKSDKVENIKNELGYEGVYYYYMLNDISKSFNKNGNLSLNSDKLVRNVDTYFDSDEEKGYWIYNIVSKSDKVEKIYNDLGYEGVYQYYKYYKK